MRRPFQLTRWFALIGLAAICAVTLISSLLLSRFLVGSMLHRDATTSMEFVRSISEVQEARGYFTGERAADRNLVEFFNHIATMPHVLRANVFSLDRRIIWSSDPKLIGRAFDQNPELDAALAGTLSISDEVSWKPEHMFLEGAVGRFVEQYLPVHSRGEVIGVVEVYKDPAALVSLVSEGLRWVWACSIAGGAFLFAILFWLARRADGIIRRQQAQLVESESLAALGAMTSAIAHGIRNPLASIRSSAELGLDSPPAGRRESCEDILSEVDRLERWVRDLLAYSVPEPGEPEDVRVADVLRDSLAEFSEAFRRRNIAVHWVDSHPSASVLGDRGLLTQVFNSLLTNAMEAMPQGGSLTIETDVGERGGLLRVRVTDTGVGIPHDALADVFVPFRSSKHAGLGVGLALAKRILERFGGTIRLASTPGRGTTVDVHLLEAR
jgi:signal transduction histidine kinase